MKTNYSKLFACLLPAFLFLACSNQSPSISKESPPRYLFYLHGRIIEEQGIHAVSEQFGQYEYTAILDTLEQHQFTVISEARPRNTDINTYANKLTKEVSKLINTGIPPENITILGASKGAVIAMVTASQLGNPKVNFVLLGNCNEWVVNNMDINLHGNILSIYEETDSFGGTCEDIIEKSTGIQAFKEIPLHTKLGHGFLYRPLKEWVRPTVDWANKVYEK